MPPQAVAERSQLSCDAPLVSIRCTVARLLCLGPGPQSNEPGRADDARGRR